MHMLFEPSLDHCVLDIHAQVVKSKDTIAAGKGSNLITEAMWLAFLKKRKLEEEIGYLMGGGL